MAIWYPDVPGPSLCLNEYSFPPRDHYLGGYNPLLWTSLGGPGGAYLRHFTGLSVVWGRGVHRIDFAHDVTVPFEQRTLGCLDSGPWTENIDFAVDGPGGEIIEAVEVFRYNAEEVRLRCMVEEGDLAAFRRSYDLSGITTLGVISEVVGGEQAFMNPQH
ncbi:F-box domain-containing protein [Colletotrichum musicola]|uniref:F-box domain-containing protein n=1 Tax=Colletotrichum musicola TaxID=2175873 RepID=A0A8H6JQQ6_9PEZI|nr:F-box domain-containing protein [Colletotrichum musicola]